MGKTTIAVSASPRRVLVVDDETNLTFLLQALLKTEGFEPIVAHTGREALRLAHKERPDLILLDVVLPDLDGREICRQIRAEPSIAGTFVILMSGSEISLEDRIQGLSIGADEYLAKPIHARELLARIGSFLRIRDMTEELRRAKDELELRVAERTRELKEANESLVAEVNQRRRGEARLESYAGELRALSHRLLQAQEAERRRLARELHDEAGRSLTLLKYCLDSIEGAASVGAHGELVARGQESLRDLSSLVRNLYQELRPSILDELGLVPALLWELNRFTLQTRVEVRFEHEGADGIRFPPEVETAVYRIAQESLTNIARHSRVTDAHVSLRAGERILELKVSDLGAGFDPVRKPNRLHGAGLIGMSERAQLLGGCVRVISSPGEGTQVIAHFPLNESGAESLRHGTDAPPLRAHLTDFSAALAR